HLVTLPDLSEAGAQGARARRGAVDPAHAGQVDRTLEQLPDREEPPRAPHSGDRLERHAEGDAQEHEGRVQPEAEPGARRQVADRQIADALERVAGVEEPDAAYDLEYWEAHFLIDHDERVAADGGAACIARAE